VWYVLQEEEVEILEDPTQILMPFFKLVQLIPFFFFFFFFLYINYMQYKFNINLQCFSIYFCLYNLYHRDYIFIIVSEY